MPVDPLSLALMAVNVGASVFNNWRNNKQSHKLQEKQQEFARAATERNKQRMWQLMREGQELALEMERETHENRLEDIRNDFDRILHRLAYAQAINSWPLKVLPIVMKNQSLGSLTATADENIAIHCILTSSNCIQFNKHILPTIEEKLADFCNLHWSTLSSHPILFYSGAWKTGTTPTGVEISQLKTNLRNLPTLLITPFFKPEGGIVFQINAWGIGVELETEIECADFSYAESYKSGIDYLQEEDIKERTIEEFIPYLQCLVGYIADQYFWTNHNESPLLPTLLAMKVVNTDGMQYLNTASEERYSNLLDVCVEESLAMPFSPEKMLSLLEGSASLWDEKTRYAKLEEIFICYCNQKTCKNINDSNSISKITFCYDDLPILQSFQRLSNNKTLPYLGTIITKLIKNEPMRFTRKNFPQDLYTTIEQPIIDLVDIIDEFIKYCKATKLSDVDILIRQDFMQTFMFHTYDSNEDKILYFEMPFNRSYKIKEIRKSRNVNSVFSYGKTKEISCNINRINILRDKLLTEEYLF